MFGNNNFFTDAWKHHELRGLISNEAEDTSGKTAAEIERVIYARVSSFDFLERAAGAERQEQWQIKVPRTEENAAAGSIRVRKVTNLQHSGSGVQYILTSKLKVGQAGGSAETSEQSSADQFTVFKYMANSGMLKDRYRFPIENTDLFWEVDCFPAEGARYNEWVKVDLENWPRGKELPPLPFNAAETIDGDDASHTEETKAKVDRLYEEIFLLKNTNTPIESGDAPPPKGENAQPEVAADTGATNDEHIAEATKNNEDHDDNQGNPEDDKQSDPTDGLGEKTSEAFSSAGQVLGRLIPILGPLVTRVHAQRGVDLGFAAAKQHTTRTIAKIDERGRKNERIDKTGSFILGDLADAKDYIDLIERAVKQTHDNIKNIDVIDLHLWPQKDGRYRFFNIKTDRDGELSIVAQNNPGKLKWFSLSLAGKRSIKLRNGDVSGFKFNGRTISCPFDGRIVEFDIGQLRLLSYQTAPKNNEFEINTFNFDA